MPIPVAVRQTGYRVVRLPGLPDFNGEDFRWVMEDLGGWDDGFTPTASLVEHAGPGQIAVGPWHPTAAYYDFRGSIDAHPAEHPLIRQQLIAAIGHDADSPVMVVEPSSPADDRQSFVRVYDRRTIAMLGRVVSFTLPLVAQDPHKYAVDALTGTMGVFTGETWFRTYDPLGFDRTYDSLGFFRRYQQQAAAGIYPQAATLVSPGTEVSRRVRIEVTGPLARGDWQLVHEESGARLWAELDLVAGQTIVFDCHAQTATLAGVPVDHLVFGDYLTLAPGANTYRLVSGTQQAGFASLIDALPAFS